MDVQPQSSSPTFPTNMSDGGVPPQQTSSQFNPVRSDHSAGQMDGYDSNRSPTGSATAGDSSSAKRRKVNHGKSKIIFY